MLIFEERSGTLSLAAGGVEVRDWRLSVEADGRRLGSDEGSAIGLA